MSKTETTQYLSGLAKFLKRDLDSPSPVRHNGAIRRLIRSQPQFAGRSVEYVREHARHTDFLDTIAIENGFDSWRAVVGDVGGDTAQSTGFISNLEIRRSCGFSTAHIPLSDGEILDGQVNDEDQRLVSPAIASYPEGYFLWVAGVGEDAEPGIVEGYEQRLTDAGFSDALIHLTRIARANGCVTLLLDADAPIYPNLPQFDWEEDATMDDDLDLEGISDVLEDVGREIRRDGITKVSEFALALQWHGYDVNLPAVRKAVIEAGFKEWLPERD